MSAPYAVPQQHEAGRARGGCPRPHADVQHVHSGGAEGGGVGGEERAWASETFFWGLTVMYPDRFESLGASKMTNLMFSLSTTLTGVMTLCCVILSASLRCCCCCLQHAHHVHSRASSQPPKPPLLSAKPLATTRTPCPAQAPSCAPCPRFSLNLCSCPPSLSENADGPPHATPSPAASPPPFPTSS